MEEKVEVKHREARIEKPILMLTLKQFVIFILIVLLFTNIVTFFLVRSAFREDITKLQFQLELKKTKEGKLGEIEGEIKQLPKKMSFEKIQGYAFAIHESYENYPTLSIFEPSELVRLVYVESGFDPHAVSEKGAEGCLQLMPSTSVAYNLDDVFDCEENIRVGLRYLAHLSGRYKDKKLALMGYLTGEGNLDWHLRQFRRGVPLPDYLHEYVGKILL